jgi:hypothetical protein
VLKRILIVMFVAVAGACGSSTSTEQAWTTPRPVRPLSNIVTVYISHDGALRRNAEDQMASRLAANGIHAVPSYVVLPNQDMTDHQAVKQKLLALGYDGVFAMRLIGTDTQIDVQPTFVGYWGGAWAYNDAWMYTQTIVRVETNLYSLPDDRLVWSAQSKTFDPSSTGAAVTSVTKYVARKVEKTGIIASSGQPMATTGT